MLVVPVSAKTIKPNTTVDKLLGEIGQCTSITLAKCPELKKAVDKGPKHVPYLANKLANGETPILRLASAHVLQFFPQEEGLRALAYQLSRERDRKVLSAIKQSLTVRGEAPVLRIARELLKSEEPGERMYRETSLSGFAKLSLCVASTFFENFGSLKISPQLQHFLFVHG